MTRLFVLLFFLLPGYAWSHGGGLDSNGCHTEKRTGQYHCHRGSSPRAAMAQPAVKRALGGSVSYANCAEARAAGAAPVRRGDPGYSARLDRDNDGIGCE